MQFSSIRRDWFANPIREMLAGAVATFALIPEVIAFSFVAGVDPQVGSFASFVIGIVIAFTGGRPAMISAAAGSGKTAVLVERIIQKLCDEIKPLDVDKLLVVTFTNAAAAEMKEKIGQALHKAIKNFKRY